MNTEIQIPAHYQLVERNNPTFELLGQSAKKPVENDKGQINEERRKFLVHTGAFLITAGFGSAVGGLGYGGYKVVKDLVRETKMQPKIESTGQTVDESYKELYHTSCVENVQVGDALQNACEQVESATNKLTSLTSSNDQAREEYAKKVGRYSATPALFGFGALVLGKLIFDRNYEASKDEKK